MDPASGSHWPRSWEGRRGGLVCLCPSALLTAHGCGSYSPHHNGLPALQAPFSLVMLLETVPSPTSPLPAEAIVKSTDLRRLTCHLYLPLRAPGPWHDQNCSWSTLGSQALKRKSVRSLFPGLESPPLDLCALSLPSTSRDPPSWELGQPHQGEVKASYQINVPSW